MNLPYFLSPLFVFPPLSLSLSLFRSLSLSFFFFPLISAKLLYRGMVSYSHLSVYRFAMQSLMMSLTSFAICILSSISICRCSQYAFDRKKNRRGVIIEFTKVSIKLLLHIFQEHDGIS